MSEEKKIPPVEAANIDTDDLMAKMTRNLRIAVWKDSLPSWSFASVCLVSGSAVYRPV